MAERAKSMNCNHVREHLDYYLDGELADLERGEIEAHLSGCDDCARVLASRRDMKSRLRGLASCSAPTAGFEGRLCAALADVKIGSAGAAPERRGGWVQYALLAAAVLAVSVSAAFALGTDDEPSALSEGEVAGQADMQSPVVAESVNWHRRNVPVEVTGPDSDTVSAWFEDKVEFPVRLPELDGRANLLGGRLSNISHSEAAFLVYEVGGEKLSVLMFDANDLAIPGFDDGGSGSFVDNSSGYNVAVQQRDGVTYTFTSAMPESRLTQLVGYAFE